MPTQVRSYSKINLGLAIGPPRADGFHGLATVYQTLEMHDLVTVAAVRSSATKIVLTTDDVRVPIDHHNTAWRMVDAALLQMGVDAEVDIHIEKRLPVQGGLGAGSANAAAALIGLESELGLRLEREFGPAWEQELDDGFVRELGQEFPRKPVSRELGPQIPDAARLACAAKIGSDVPLFLIGGTVLGCGRGEEVIPLRDLPPTWCVVAAPAVGVSTPQAFRDWDALHLSGTGDEIAAGLTRKRSSDRLAELSRTLAATFGAVVFGEPHSSGVSALGGDLAENPLLALVRTGIENDFEEVVFPQYPLLGNIKRTLAASAGQPFSGDTEDEAIYAALSGSGSALFGLYGTEAAAREAYGRVAANRVPAFLTRTMPRDRYWNEMLVHD